MWEPIHFHEDFCKKILFLNSTGVVLVNDLLRSDIDGETNILIPLYGRAKINLILQHMHKAPGLCMVLFTRNFTVVVRVLT